MNRRGGYALVSNCIAEHLRILVKTGRSPAYVAQVRRIIEAFERVAADLVNGESKDYVYAAECRRRLRARRRGELVRG